MAEAKLQSRRGNRKNQNVTRSDDVILNNSNCHHPDHGSIIRTPKSSMTRAASETTIQYMHRRSSKFSKQRYFLPLVVWLLLPCLSRPANSSHAGSLPSSRVVLQQMSQSIMKRLKEDSVGLLSAGFYYGMSRNAISSIGKSDAAGLSLLQGTKASRCAEFLAIGRQIERWAEELLAENNDIEAGWTAIECNKAFRNKYNKHGSTKQYVKWMRDSREDHANQKDTKKHPCMKLYSTIDAPFHLVCQYLSQGHRYREYNSLLVDQRDVEELTPDSKICWSQTKKLLFIQPRDFVTYCFHRWKRDGTQVVVNQACDHPEMTQNDDFRAYSLRGATYIQRDANAPTEKTRLIMLSHCNCGDDIPEWAVRTAVGVLAPIKPFEIVHRIGEGVKRAKNGLKQDDIYAKTSKREARSSRPAGIAQMGYACFWPDGGGKVEKTKH